MKTSKNSKNKILIISLGGSIIVPKEINVKFLKQFKNFILKHKNKKFVITCGGGYTNKVYNQAAKKLSKVSNEDLDWIGIKTTKLNAELVRAVFSNIAYEKVIDNPTLKIKTAKRIIIGAGWKPGASTDLDAVLLAKNFGAKTVINLTNIDYVYNKDPRKYPNAKPIKEISWVDYKKIIGKKWGPRAHAPFDPVASNLAEKLRLRVIILKGTNLKNLDNYLKGNKFRGTLIK